MELRPYQEKGTKDVAAKLSKGLSPVVYQLATGGGKTVTFATISKRYNDKSGKKVLILVHREELLRQTLRTLYEWYGIIGQSIDAGIKKLPDSTVYVGMCETVFRRLNKVGFLPEFGLIIIDEAHLGNYKKLLTRYTGKLIIGFTATPLSATKKDPLKNYFNDIVCGIDIPELIKNSALCQNHTYRIKGISRQSLSVSKGDFDEHQMSEEYSKSKHVQNTIVGYEKYAKGSKTIIFNCNIMHSKIVCDAFIAAGYNCRHIDGNSQDRQQALLWLKNTPDAILCNIGILTTGFDEPSVKTIIVNKATMSLPLWLQMTGRGSRPNENKPHFTIIDMGDNVSVHGDWSDKRDWNELFNNPPKPSKKEGVAPIKDCPECEKIIPAQAMTCKYCGYIFPHKEEVYDTLPPEFERVVRNVDVAEIINSSTNYKEYYAFFNIGNNIATQAKYMIKEMSDDIAKKIHLEYLEKIKEWCQIKNKKYSQWHHDTSQSHLYEQLAKIYKHWDSDTAILARLRLQKQKAA